MEIVNTLYIFYLNVINSKLLIPKRDVYSKQVNHAKNCVDTYWYRD